MKLTPDLQRQRIKMKNIVYIPNTGNNAGKEHTPHLFNDGFYVVSKTRFVKDYIKVKTLEDVYEYYKKGLKVRMSYNGLRASLISPSSIQEI